MSVFINILYYPSTSTPAKILLKYTSLTASYLNFKTHILGDCDVNT